MMTWCRRKYDTKHVLVSNEFGFYTMFAAQGSETPHKFQNDEIEKLAKREHERWMQKNLHAE